MTTPPSSAVLSNTEALHKIFDAEFPALLAQARQELGEAVSLAPRVAEGAFVRAWDARGRLQTLDQVKQFLRDDVKAAAARALARRAAIQQSGEAGQISLSTAEHVAASTATMDLKVSWSHIVLAIQLDPQAAHSEKMSAEEYRHETAERLDHATRRSPLVAASILLVIVVVAIGVTMYFNRMTTELAIERAMASPNGKVTTSPTIRSVTGIGVRRAPAKYIWRWTGTKWMPASTPRAAKWSMNASRRRAGTRRL